MHTHTHKVSEKKRLILRDNDISCFKQTKIFIRVYVPYQSVI
jgi:hypothetical protein